MKLSGREKATIFLSILGSDTSSAILRYLPPELSDLIASSINNLPTPTPEALGEVFTDFKSYVALPPPVRARIETPQPPITMSTSMTPNEVIEVKKDETPRERILNSSSKKIAYLLADERPQLSAFILSMFPAMQREEILMNISSGKDEIDELLTNLKPTSLKDKLEDKLIKYFAERI